MSRKLLEVRGISKIYRIYESNRDRLLELFFKKRRHREFVANDALTFDLHEGETLGIIGVNGAGKSTILKIIAGVIEPTAGEVLRHGRVTALLELGTGFNMEMSGYENIYLNGTLIGMERREIDDKIDRIIAFSELGDYIREPVKSYSSGMAMRLAFSIAIHSEPQVLIVDEALSVGDAHFQQKCMRALKERKARNMSIIYVSHDLNSLKLLCDRVILLHGGAIALEGEPEEVVNTYNYHIAMLNEREGEPIRIRRVDESHGTFEAEIMNVKIVGSRSGSDILASGEGASISVDLLSHVEMRDISVGIVIRDRFGQDIFGARSCDYQGGVSIEKGGHYRMLYRFDANVGPGNYTISAAVHSDTEGENRRLSWQDNACTFSVSGSVGRPFVGLCRLDPEVVFTQRDADDELLVTTSKSLLYVDVRKRRIVRLHTGQGLYYGIASDGRYTYVAARNRMLSSETARSEEVGTLLKFDCDFELVEEMQPPFPMRDIHQIRWVEGKLYVTCSYDNMIAVYDGRSWEAWYPTREEGRDVNHFNSLFADTEHLYILAHNFGASEVYVFDIHDRRFLHTVAMGRSAHNIWIDRLGNLCTLSSDEAKMVNSDHRTLLELEGFPRGIAMTERNIYIGISERAERAERDFVDGKVLLYSDEGDKFGELRLVSEGMVLEIRTINRRDHISGEFTAVDAKRLEAIRNGAGETAPWIAY